MMLYTSCIGGPSTGQVIDITVKSARGIWRELAPTWDIVRAYKGGDITNEQYTEMYKALLRERTWHVKIAMDTLIDMAQNGDVTLVCYCRPGAFCHRLLLAKWLEAKGVEYGGEVGDPCP